MFLKNIDFISKDITLFYKGYDKHSNILSQILSILSFIGVICIICYLSIDVIEKKHPTSFYFTKFIEEIEDYPLNSSSILHYVSLYDSDNKEVKIDIKAINVVGISINDGIYTNDNDISKYSHWIYEDCELNDLGDYEKTFSESQLYYFKNSLCISKYFDKDNNVIINKNNINFIYPTLSHGASQHNNFEYGIYFQRCQNNSLINNNNCYSKNDQDIFIRKIIGYEINFIDNSIDVENYKNPIIYSVHRITSEINKNSFVLNHLNFHPVVIKTNDGLFMDNLSNKIAYNFDYNEKITHATEDYKFLGTFNFWMQNTIDTYERAYKKIQDIAGGVDGIVQIMFLAIKLINNIFFNNYQELCDFNNELHWNLDMKNKRKKLININNEKKSNNKGNKVIVLKDTLNDDNNNNIVFTSMRSKSLINKKSVYITNSDINNSENSFRDKNNNKNLNKYLKEKRPKKINWLHFFINNLRIKTFNYVEFLKEKREFIVSEERFLEIYFYLSNIQDKIKNNNFLFSDNERIDSNNTNNDIEGNYNNLDINPPLSPLVLNK